MKTATFQIIEDRREQFIPAIMLLLLQLSTSLGISSALAQSLLLAHLGFFLIWQPIWRRDQRLNLLNSSIFLILTLSFVWFINWWLIAGWLVLMLGFTGGCVVASPRESRTNMLILLFLIVKLLILLPSKLFLIIIPVNIMDLANFLLLGIPLLIVLVPGQRVTDQKIQVDLFGATTAALLSGLLLLGSLIQAAPLGNDDYLTALAKTSFITGVFLLLISWLLSPRSGFSGLRQLWTQSLLNIGTPFETWISDIANLARDKNDATDFLRAAMQKLTQVPMISGVAWQTEGITGDHGDMTDIQNSIQSGDLDVKIMSKRNVSPTLLLHFKLLIRIIDHFYRAKRQEQTLSQQAHMQLIYETGARVTHDIKNLLQALKVLAAMLQDTENNNEEDSRYIIHNQLPSLTRRLETALDKLQVPEHAITKTVYLKDWWQELTSRRHQLNIDFHAEILNDPQVPAELFDSVMDNWLENLQAKAANEPELAITISLLADDTNIQLIVCDNGSRIPEEISQHLLSEPVSSANGLGIGLHQAMRQAESLEYKLELTNNDNGRVCFALSKLN